MSSKDNLRSPGSEQDVLKEIIQLMSKMNGDSMKGLEVDVKMDGAGDAPPSHQGMENPEVDELAGNEMRYSDDEPQESFATEAGQKFGKPMAGQDMEDSDMTEDDEDESDAGMRRSGKIF